MFQVGMRVAHKKIMAIVKIKPNSFIKLKRQIHSVKETLKYIMALDGNFANSFTNPLINPLSLLLTILCNEHIPPKISVLLMKEAKSITEALEWLQSAPIEASYKRRIIRQLGFLRNLSLLFASHAEASYAVH